MLVPLNKIKPNPERDLALYPINQEKVAKLVHSIHEHGFFGGCKARKTPATDGKKWDGTYQLGCGHHRIEAAKQAGLKEIDIVVSDMDDDEMTILMTNENATQDGSNAAAVMNDVAAATRRLAFAMLTEEDLSEISERFPAVGRAFSNQKSFDTAVGTLKKGDGVGSPIIMRYLGGGDEKNCPRHKQVVIDAIAALKQSGGYTKIIDSIESFIAKEKAKAEREEKEAEKKAEVAEQEAAKATTEKQREKKKAKATTEKKKAAKHSTKRKKLAEAEEGLKEGKAKRETANPHVLDPRCANVFKNDHQFAAFREAVTTEAARRVIPISKQLALAKTLMQELAGRISSGDRVGAPFIKDYVRGVVAEAIGAQRAIDQRERKRLELQASREALYAHLTNVGKHLTSASTAITKVKDVLEREPTLASDHRLQTLGGRIDEVVAKLTSLKRSIVQNA